MKIRKNNWIFLISKKARDQDQDLNLKKRKIKKNKKNKVINY